MKNTLGKKYIEGIKSSLKNAEEHINDLEDRVVAITPVEQQKEKKNLNKRGLRDDWDNSKCTKICITGYQKKREEAKNLSEKI